MTCRLQPCKKSCLRMLADGRSMRTDCRCSAAGTSLETCHLAAAARTAPAARRARMQQCRSRHQRVRMRAGPAERLQQQGKKMATQQGKRVITQKRARPGAGSTRRSWRRRCGGARPGRPGRGCACSCRCARLYRHWMQGVLHANAGLCGSCREASVEFGTICRCSGAPIGIMHRDMVFVFRYLGPY